MHQKLIKIATNKDHKKIVREIMTLIYNEFKIFNVNSNYYLVYRVLLQLIK